MKIKIHEHEKKATIRFTHPAEIDWFKIHMATIRDDKVHSYPPISLKNEKGNIHLPKPPSGPPPIVNKEDKQDGEQKP